MPGPASDRYALGVIAFELLVGQAAVRRVERARHDGAALSRDGPDARRSRGASQPPAIDEVLQRALAKDPDARYPTARELVAALRDRGRAPRQARGGDRAVRTDAAAHRGRRRSVLGALVVGVHRGAGACNHDRGNAAERPSARPHRRPGTIAIDVTSTPDSALVSVAGTTGRRDAAARCTSRRDAHVDLERAQARLSAELIAR